jgi:hypothetical protein
VTWRHPERNPSPAYGRDVLTLAQLRHYVRLFWTERRYGICALNGGKAAFLRFVGPEYTQHVRDKLLAQPPKSEYLSKPLQRLLSRKVLQVLRGQVIFVEVDSGATWRPMLGCPEPPDEDFRPMRDHEFRVERTVIGPKIRKLPIGF